MNSFVRRLLTVVGFVVFANFFFFRPMGSVAVALLTLGFFAFLLISHIKSETLERQTTTIAGFSLFFLITSIAIIWRGNTDIQALMMLTSWAGLVFCTYILASGIPFVRSLFELLLAPFGVFAFYIVSGFEKVGFVFSSRLRKSVEGLPLPKEITQRSLPVMTGLVIGIPIVVFLVSLFAQADPIYAKTLQSLVKFLTLGEIWWRLFFSFLVLAFVTPFVNLAIKANFATPTFSLGKFTSTITVVMLLVAIALGSFLVVQAPYIFVRVAQEQDLSRYGVATYSEYVKKGFGELLFIASFLYGLSWIGLLSLRGKKDTEKTMLPWVQSAVLFELGIFILSIARRIKLYWNFHGLSLVRVYGGFFLIFVAGMTFTLFLRHFLKKRWVIAEVGFTALLVIIAGLWNAENFIVHNHPPTVNRQVDYVYLSRMSSDGYDGWKMAFDKARNVLTNPEYDNKTIITKEDRRDIAYAGLVLLSLSEKYDDLVNTYGTKEEWKAYQTAIMEQERRQDDVFWRKLQDSISLLQTKGAGVNTPMDVIAGTGTVREQRGIYMQSMASDTLAISSALKESMEVLGKDKGETQVSLVIRHFVFPTSLTLFSKGSCDYSYMNVSSGQCKPGFYRFSNGKMSFFYPPEGWNKTLAWNGGDAAAFTAMKQEMPFSNILALQDRYVNLYYKIVSQPGSELEYQNDISLQTPFLGGWR